MDTKQKIKDIRKLVQERVKLLQDIDGLRFYKEKLEKVKKEYERKT